MTWAKAGRRQIGTANGQRKFHAWRGNVALCGKVAPAAPPKVRSTKPSNSCRVCEEKFVAIVLGTTDGAA